MRAQVQFRTVTSPYTLRNDATKHNKLDCHLFWIAIFVVIVGADRTNARLNRWESIVYRILSHVAVCSVHMRHSAIRRFGIRLWKCFVRAIADESRTWTQTNKKQCSFRSGVDRIRRSAAHVIRCVVDLFLIVVKSDNNTNVSDTNRAHLVLSTSRMQARARSLDCNSTYVRHRQRGLSITDWRVFRCAGRAGRA